MESLDRSTLKYDHVQSIKEVQAEISKPFEEKLKRTKQLIGMFAKTPNACVSCSFGKDSMVVLYLCLQVNSRIAVNFNNTLIEFPETMKLMRQTWADWDLNLAELRPEKGITFWTVNDRILSRHLKLDDGKKYSNICCWHLKEKPFKQWAKRNRFTKCFTGITAVESRNRLLNIACMKGTDYYSYKIGMYKIHPILYWTPQEVLTFTNDIPLPLNEAYGKYGLDRIGCMYCMSHKGWRKQICRIAPQVYDFMLKRYFNAPRISDPSFHSPGPEAILHA